MKLTPAGAKKDKTMINSDDEGGDEEEDKVGVLIHRVGKSVTDKPGRQIAIRLFNRRR
jgi:hypothetical protein